VPDPSFTCAKFCLGLAYEQKGAYGEALPRIEAALAEWPVDAGARRRYLTPTRHREINNMPNNYSIP